METKYLSQVRTNQKIKIVDPEILAKWPKFKDMELICSVIKMSGPRIFFQFFSTETGSGTLKLINNPQVEILGDEKILTLAQFLSRNRYKTEHPKSITLNCNGTLEIFEILPKFWEQNPTNIKIRHLKNRWETWSVPGSSLVHEIHE